MGLHELISHSEFQGAGGSPRTWDASDGRCRGSFGLEEAQERTFGAEALSAGYQRGGVETSQLGTCVYRTVMTSKSFTYEHLAIF